MTSHSSDSEAQRLLALSEKVGRVAESLAELALERDASQRSAPQDLNLSGESVGWLIRARRERSRFVPGALFGEPVWDIMLHLLHAEVEGHAVTVAEACSVTDLPAAVARRWLNSMADNGLVAVRKSALSAEPQVELASDVGSGLRLYFREIVEER